MDLSTSAGESLGETQSSGCTDKQMVFHTHVGLTPEMTTEAVDTINSTQQHTSVAMEQTSPVSVLPGAQHETYHVETSEEASLVDISCTTQTYTVGNVSSGSVSSAGTLSQLARTVCEPIRDVALVSGSSKVFSTGDSIPDNTQYRESETSNAGIVSLEQVSPVVVDYKTVSQSSDTDPSHVMGLPSSEGPCQANSDSSILNDNINLDASQKESVESGLQPQQEMFIGPVAPAEQYEVMDVDSHGNEEQPEGISAESYNLSDSSVPSFVTWARTEYLKTGPDNFLRGCKWSPDGNEILTNSNDNILRIFNMSDEVVENEASTDIEQMCEVRMRESSTVYDYAWFPGMDSHRPDTCRIATTCSGIPIHLWDSAHGKIVASYKAFDQYDEVTAAYSLSFSASGNQVLGGYKKSIRVFDTEYPGKKCQFIKTCGPKKSWSEPGQTGIISCFAHSPTSEGFLAAGSYTRHIGLYDLRCDGLTCVIEGQRGGITHLMFTPDGNKLLSGARKDNEILCWDMRNLGVMCFSALRDVRTNQRMYFDITRCGRYMTSGNDDGTVTFWDLTRPTDTINDRSYLRPVAQYQAHNDSVNGVSFHPDGKFVATASGQRHFLDFSRSDSSDSNDDDDQEKMVTRDFSLRVWKIPSARDRECAG